jgi:DNA polymerase III subunit delta
MVAYKAGDVDSFVKRPDPKRPIVLVFGPDAGLVRERVDAIVKASVDDPNDPFALARLDGDSIADEPNRLVEEALTVPLFGGRRAVWVRAGNRSINAGVEMLIATPPAGDCRVVIEAGDLKRNAPLRALCEKTSIAAALPCYADSDQNLGRLIDEELRAAGLTIAPDAKTMLLALIGGDRRASRNEIQKLALYAHGQERVEIDDIVAVVADASALAMDGLIDATFAGKPRDLEAQFVKARAAGTHPVQVIGAALRQVIQLHQARAAIESSADATEAVFQAFPMVRTNFRRKPIIEAAAKSWTVARLEKLMAQFAEASLETRRRPALAEAIAQRALLIAAMTAARRG